MASSVQKETRALQDTWMEPVLCFLDTPSKKEKEKKEVPKYIFIEVEFDQLLEFELIVFKYFMNEYLCRDYHCPLG